MRHFRNAAVKAVLVALPLVTASAAHAQLVFDEAPAAVNFSVLCNFTGGSPSGLAGGGEYGTTFDGGGGYGTVFEVSGPIGYPAIDTLYSFEGTAGNDGAGPVGLTVESNGALYGVTQAGGDSACPGIPAQYEGCGTVYELTPKTGKYEVLYRFTGGADGYGPYGQPVLNQGDIYGTTFLGGTYGDCIQGYACGTVFKLTKSGSKWRESAIWDFGQGNDGAEPAAGVIFDKSGNIYGTTVAGGSGRGSSCGVQGHTGCGVVYELTPSGSGWTETILYNFQGGTDGGAPYSGVVMDHSGNLYGATALGGSGGGGTIYELSPSGGGWNFTVLYPFSGSGTGPSGQCPTCTGPLASLTLGSGDELEIFGTTYNDGAIGYGMAFEMTFSKKTGIWTFYDLHDFTGGSDGGNVVSGLEGLATSLWGVTSSGGTNGAGVLFQLMWAGCGGPERCVRP